MTHVRTFQHPSGLVQQLAVADLIHGGDAVFRQLCGGRIAVVYSDPPWNPGNEKWWRRHAGVEPPERYDALLDAWCRCAADCAADHIFTEQSINPKHLKLFLDAVERCPGWTLPLLEQWTVYYGSPGSRGCARPNVLLHFGREPITTNPEGMRGQPMTTCVFDGIPDLVPGATVGDPCMGKGMTSREAHAHALHCVGTELNPARLEKTIAWLRKQGYVEVEGGRDVAA